VGHGRGEGEEVGNAGGGMEVGTGGKPCSRMTP
jgi:hypothetical protein